MLCLTLLPIHNVGNGNPSFAPTGPALGAQDIEPKDKDEKQYVYRIHT